MDKFNSLKLKSYQKDLKDLHDKIETGLKLNPEEIQHGHALAKQYYSELKAQGVSYGAMALDVLNNSPGFGRFANLHLESEAQYYGRTPEQIERIKAEYPILLAAHDASLRLGSKTGLINDNIIIIQKHFRSMA